MDFLADLIRHHPLTLITFLPLAGAVLIVLLPRDAKRTLKGVSLLISLLPLALALWMWAYFEPQATGLQFQEQAVWFPQIHAGYHVGIDGLSLTLLLLTTLLVPLALLTSFTIRQQVRAYCALFLALETGLLGVFVAQDLLLFFTFWEIGLVPMYFLINIWGGERRVHAASKFFLYTMAGSVGLLLAIQVIGLSVGSFDLPRILRAWPGKQLSLLGLPSRSVKAIGFWAFALAFAIKIPLWPFHTWLPDAHTEAPTGGSMILAGVMLKLGAYGFLRLVLPLFPAQAAQFAGVLAVLGLISVILGPLAALGQDDLKRVVAYASVGHMGLVVLGIAASARTWGQWPAPIAASGVVLQMFNHGISSAALFALVGVIYERTHTRDLQALGGFMRVMPIYGGTLLFSALASLGLPGLNGFVGEFLILQGSWPAFTLVTGATFLGLILTAGYTLRIIQKVLLGPANPRWYQLPEMSPREIGTVAPLMALMLLTGVWPAWIVGVFNPLITRWFG